ncbi:MAG: hypothetical protein FJ265_00670 [Planctomycetes bacterium]|nr:hypothetical protein [Planctomycetota bacterium]
MAAVATAAPAAAPPAGSWRATAALVLGFGLLYALLRQPGLHGTDALTLQRWLDEPRIVHPHHPLYLEAARGLRWLLAPCGAGGIEAMGWLSVLGGALAVGAMHRAARALRGSPAFAVWLAVCAGCAPALLYFATLPELHAPFLAVAALAWWATVVAARASSWRIAALAGALGALATLCHATGQLLVPLLGTAPFWLAGLRLRRAAPLLLAFALAHALLWAAGYHGLRALGDPLPDSSAFLSERAGSGEPLAHFVAALGTEWLWAFLPLPVVALAGLWRGAALPAAFVLLGGLGYAAVTAVLVQGQADEAGAYALPLLFPLAAVALDALPRRHRGLLAVLVALGALGHQARHRTVAPDHEFGRAAAAFAAEAGTVWLVGAEIEAQAVRWHAPRAELVEAWAVWAHLAPRLSAPLGEQEAFLWLEAQAALAHGEGARLVVTDAAVAFLVEQVPAFGPAWARFCTPQRARRIEGFAGLRGVVIAPR